MNEFRGMKVVGDVLTKKEATKKLRKGVQRSLRLCDRGLPRRIHELHVAAVLATAEYRHALNQYAVGQLAEKAIDPRDLYSPVKKELRKRDKIAAAKCLGTSKKECPRCVSKHRGRGRLKIWPMPWGGKCLLCSVCGWTDRKTIKEPRRKVVRKGWYGKHLGR